jgi:phage gp46-like protein
MADIKSVFVDLEKGVDYALEQLGLTEDDGLDTAVIISLFTDRQAEASDVIPDGTDDKRGHWSDSFPDIDGDLIGSRLWLLTREKQLPEVMVRTREYCEEALAWMVEDGVGREVIVTVTNPKEAILYAVIEIAKPDGTATRYQFENFWRA